MFDYTTDVNSLKSFVYRTHKGAVSFEKLILRPMLYVNYVFTATFAIANKKAEKAVETSDLSTSDADVGELLVRNDGKRQTCRPLAFSPVREQVTARRAQVDIHAKANKSSASSLLNELPPVPHGLSQHNVHKESVIICQPAVNSQVQGCNLGISTTMSKTLHMDDHLTTKTGSMGKNSNKNQGHEVEFDCENPNYIDDSVDHTSIIASDLSGITRSSEHSAVPDVQTEHFQLNSRRTPINEPSRASSTSASASIRVLCSPRTFFFIIRNKIINWSFWNYYPFDNKSSRW